MQLNCHIDYCRYPCDDCGERFTTGRLRNAHRCTRPQQPAKRRRTTGPASDPAGTTSAVDGLFKTIEILPATSTINVVEALHAETDRIADILRLLSN